MKLGAQEARDRIKDAAAVKNNDSPDTLARVAIRDGEHWNDRRLPEMGRALAAALAEIDAMAVALGLCPACGHEWDRHDPDDGACDAHSAEDDVGPCRCGRDVAFTAAANARRSSEALVR